jgi:phage baseplate assembly protein W
MPFNAASLFGEDGGAAETCSQATSIAQHLMLLITTQPGEHRYDQQYGNAVWQFDFDNSANQVLWEETFVNSLLQQIARYEPRIVHPAIKVHTAVVEHTYKTRRYSEIKKKATVAIQAVLADSGETFHFATEIFLSPMSVD